MGFLFQNPPEEIGGDEDQEHGDHAGDDDDVDDLDDVGRLVFRLDVGPEMTWTLPLAKLRLGPGMALPAGLGQVGRVDRRDLGSEDVRMS